MNHQIELSIIMPCLNEVETLEACILKAKSFIETFGIQAEIVIGDNGSTDGSLEIAQRLGVRIVNVPIKGYGAALAYAIRASHGKFVIMADSDDSYDFFNLMPMLEKLRLGFDLVMGNRFKGGIAPGAMPWKNKWIGNPALTGIGKILFRSPINDFHCGQRGFSRSAFFRMRLKATGMEFASEMVLKASLMKLKLTEVPVTLSKDGRSRPPHLKPWRDGWRHLRLMFLFCPRWLFLIPGILAILLGLLMGMKIIFSAVVVGGLEFQINSMIYTGAVILIGFQSCSFAVFTKIFAIQEGLLPEDHRLSRLFKFVTLETGLLVGIVLFGIGTWGLFHELAIWKASGFTRLDPVESVKITFPSAIAFVLSFQIIFSSFFLSVLGLKLDRRHE